MDQMVVDVNVDVDELAWTTGAAVPTDTKDCAILTHNVQTRTAMNRQYVREMFTGMGTCTALPHAMFVLKYHLTMAIRTDAAALPVDCSYDDFVRFASTCVNEKLLTCRTELADISVQLPTTTGHAFATGVVSAVHDAMFDGDGGVVPANAVVFNSPQYAKRIETLLMHTDRFVSDVRAYLTECVLALQSIIHTSNAAGTLVWRLTSRAVQALYARKSHAWRRHFAGAARVSETALWNKFKSIIDVTCVYTFILYEVLTLCGGLDGSLFDMPPVEFGTEVAHVFIRQLMVRHVVTVLKPLPFDCAPLMMVTTTEECRVLLAEVFDICASDLYIEPYVAAVWHAEPGYVCPIAVLTRMLSCGNADQFAPSTTSRYAVATVTAARLRLRRGQVMAAVSVARNIMDALPHGLYGDVYKGLYGTRLLSVLNDNYVHTNALGRGGLSLSTMGETTYRRTLRRITDVVALALVEIWRTFDIGATPAAEAVYHAEAAEVAATYVAKSTDTNDDVLIDLLPAFWKAVNASQALPRSRDVYEDKSLRPCFSSLPNLVEADMVYACTPDRDAFHAVILRLFNIATVCDCGSIPWRDAWTVLFQNKATAEDEAKAAAVANAFCLPTLSLHTVHTASPLRSAVMALLSNTAMRALMHVMSTLSPEYGCCENGHSPNLKVVLSRIADHDTDIHAAFDCVERSCNGCYDERSLAAFFSPCVRTLLSCRRAWQTHPLTTCIICETSCAGIRDGGVNVCTTCGDMTCAKCNVMAHPGELCGKL